VNRRSRLASESVAGPGPRGRRRARTTGAWTRGVLAGLASATLAACAPSCGPRAPAAAQPVFRYAVVPPPAGSFVLHVQATLEHSPTERLVAPESGGLLGDVVLVGAAGESTPVARDGDAFVASACRSRCSLRYTLDLAELAASCRRMDCARRVGDAVIDRATAFLLRPETVGDGVFEVDVVGPDTERFATGLRGAGKGRFWFKASALSEASFTAVGEMRRGNLDFMDARIDVVFLGAPLAMGDEAALEFIRQSAVRIVSLFKEFPVDTTIFVVPVADAREVVFGRVLSLAGASVVLLFGDQTPASGARDNWVVVHELFHLACPSFVGEGRWLEEGLATYYEPILRERAGWMTEAALWTHFVREMPRGLRRAEDPARLEDRDDIDSTYWGGALFALLADVRSRAATGGAESLDDVVRRVRQWVGSAVATAHVADFLRTAEKATGTHEVTGVYESWAVRGENVDLDALWGRLGIEGVEAARAQGTLVTLRDDAPLAPVRRAISASASH
jgi:predicted metalloprotease with PDZ domain